MTFFHIGYIDPGTGSILIQGLIGGFLGAAYMGRKVISRGTNTLRSILPGQRSKDGGKPEASDKA